MSFTSRISSGLLTLLLASILSAAPPATKQPIDFALTTEQGEWRLSSLRGKVVVLFFGYLSCPDVCPTSTQTIASAFKRLTPEQLARTAGVFVSLDPARDSNQQLQQFAAFFHPAILGLTGKDEAEVRAVASELGVHFRKRPGQSPDSYSIDHSALMFVIDPSGRQRDAYASDYVPADYLANVIGELLSQQP